MFKTVKIYKNDEFDKALDEVLKIKEYQPRLYREATGVIKLQVPNYSKIQKETLIKLLS